MGITLSTHILNTMTGKPAANVQVGFYSHDAQSNEAQTNQPQNEIVKQAVFISTHHTNEDGRVANIDHPSGTIMPATYELQFHIGPYFRTQSEQPATFFDIIPIRFLITSDLTHYHVPLLLSPFGYSTYRGS